MRKEARHSSEMVSEVLFGEAFDVLEKKDSWLKIKLNHDGYEGWIEHKGAFPESSETPKLRASTNGSVVGKDGQISISPGTPLPYIIDQQFELGNERYQLTHGRFRQVDAAYTIPQIVETACQFLGTPYYWGGRSSKGIDCSGFMQVVHAVYGIVLPRDAYQQAEVGNSIELNQAKAGDLAFFENKNGRITHVGLLISNHEIIHASEKVRIDRLDQKGIYRADISEYSHQLAHIQRIHD